MKVFSKEESDIIANRINSCFRNPSAGNNLNKVLTKKITPDSGKKNWYAKMISRLFLTTNSFLYITDYGVWPSSENFDLFNAYRSSLQIETPLYQSPGHVIGINENVQLYCLLCMIMYFSWGAILLSDNGNINFYFSSDEYFVMYVSEQYLNDEEINHFIDEMDLDTTKMKSLNI